jgi:hypothetical protein
MTLEVEVVAVHEASHVAVAFELHVPIIGPTSIRPGAPYLGVFFVGVSRGAS